MRSPVEELERAIQYHFSNRELLLRALTHRSFLSDWQPNRRAIDGRGNGALGKSSETFTTSSDNEQFEFLGDSILGFIVSESLVLQNPLAPEGQLSQWKSHLVSATHLHRCALEISLGDYLLLGKGEERSGGRARKTLLANAVEALIAAIYIDGGITPVREFIRDHVLGALQNQAGASSIESLNYKSILQEKIQALGLPAPHYSTVDTSGPEHAKAFTVEARVGERLVGRATGSSKKAASQEAARLLVERLRELDRKNSPADQVMSSTGLT